MPLVLLPALQANRSTRRDERGPPAGALGAAGPAVQLADASSPRPAPSISPLIAIPKALTGNETPEATDLSGKHIPLGPGSTIASWYPGRPIACFQNGARHALPTGLVMWAADKSLPCGTTIQVTGPAGTATLLIEDHGPYLTPDRGLDLSPAAFKKVVGPLPVGIAVVTFKVTHVG
ncbi:MAG TPA: septal ring lytic transglycosylase RlpA family protein [Actinomycetota bacterium]|nr:septal ring lytic transglycosylase RlpA family protein [Actinomycetota bacterium]